MAAKIENFQMFPTLEDLNKARKYQKNCLTHKDNCDHKDSNCDSISIESSNSSICSLLSSDLIEDDAISPSSTSSSSSSSSNGPLFKLQDLMDELPIKRGLSKYYQGKSQSFTKLASVESLEDLAKRENPYNKRIKLCRSYCGGFEAPKFCSPKSTTLKKSASNCLRSASFSSSTLGARRTCSNNLMASCKPPTIPSVQKDF